MFKIYCDGSSEGNSTGAIGWSFVILLDGGIVECGAGGSAIGSNNIAELTAAIEGMKALKKYDTNYAPIELISDSKYVLNLATGRFNAVKNADLAKTLRELFVELKATSRWVKGHNGDFWNEMCDKLAKHARAKYSVTKPNKKQRRKTRRQTIRELKRKLNNEENL
jgi:ribonuclease HI